MMPRILDRFLPAAVWPIAATWRVEFVGRPRMQALRINRFPRVSVLWHEHLVPLLWFNRQSGAVILASQHADGRRLAAVSRTWGYGIADGSSTRGGTVALRRMVRVLRAGGEVAIAADGPRGPRRIAKPGAAFVAARSGAVIVPVAAGAAPCIRLRSWDRLLLPAPFARVRVVYGEPVVVGHQGRAGAVASVQASLDAASRVAAC
jgi:lysophospholipid acyltransferase (LPLAT)-like uncharacterized protein